MIKLFGAVSKKDDWTDEEWMTHYRERHGPLTTTVDSFRKYAHKYIQNYALLRDPADAALRPANLALQVNGLSELWFDDLEALNAAYVDEGYMRILRTDEIRFVNLETGIIGLGKEYPVHAEPTGSDDKRWTREKRHKAFVFRVAAPGIDDATLQAGWKAAAPDIVAEKAFRRHVRRYVQTHTIDGGEVLPGGCEYGLIDEFWFDNERDAAAYCAAAKNSALMNGLEASFTQPDRTLIVISQSHVVFGD